VTVIVGRTGDAERSRLKPQDEPWLLERPASGGRSQLAMPWRMLALAAVSLLGSLICFGFARDSTGDVWERFFESWTVALALVASVGLALAFVGTLLIAVLRFLVATGGQVLPPGVTIGRGPYRSYDCRPTPRLVEGIAASVDSAADGLDAALRDDCTAPLARARSAAAAGDFAAAFAALAEALAAFTRTVATAS